MANVEGAERVTSASSIMLQGLLSDASAILGNETETVAALQSALPKILKELVALAIIKKLCQEADAAEEAEDVSSDDAETLVRIISEIDDEGNEIEGTAVEMMAPTAPTAPVPAAPTAPAPAAPTTHTQNVKRSKKKRAYNLYDDVWRTHHEDKDCPEHVIRKLRLLVQLLVCSCFVSKYIRLSEGADELIRKLTNSKKVSASKIREFASQVLKSPIPSTQAEIIAAIVAWIYTA